MVQDPIDWSGRANSLSQKVHRFMKEFGDPLEEPASFLSADLTLKPKTTTVLTGLFSADDGLASWGRAIGEALEVLLSDLTALGIEHHLNQPDPHPNNRNYFVWGLNGYTARYQLETLYQVAELMGVQHGISGHYCQTQNISHLQLSWHDLLTHQVTDTIQLNAEGDTSEADLLIGAARWVLEKTGHSCDENTLNTLATHCPQSQLKTYQNIMQKLGDRDWDYLPKTRHSGYEEARLPVLALFLMNLESERYISPADAYARYKHIHQHWHNHIWLLSLQSSIYQNEGDDYEIDREGCQLLLKSHAEKTHMIMAIPRVVNLLLETEQYRRALGLAFSFLKAKPDSFISWWTVQHALAETAWEYRGNDWAHNVSDTYADAFSDLSHYAIEAATCALELHPNNPQLITERLQLEQGATGALWEWLLDVIDIDPGYEHAYEAALNFTQPRWGGWLEYQMAIIKLAHQHNPKATWVTRLYVEYIERNSTDYDLFTRIKLLGKRLFSKNWPASFPTDDHDQEM